MEGVMRNVMYEIPSRDDVEKCVVTKETVENNIDPTLVFVDPGLKRKSKQKSGRKSTSKTNETA
jgi:ATP-dependent Clp protease ATP-binding subunit ClpX